MDRIEINKMRHTLTAGFDNIPTHARAHTPLKSNLKTLANTKRKAFCSLAGYNPVSTMAHSLCTCFPQEDNYRSLVVHTHTQLYSSLAFLLTHTHRFKTEDLPVQDELWLVMPLPYHHTLQDEKMCGTWLGHSGSERLMERRHFIPGYTDQVQSPGRRMCHSIRVIKW